MNNPEIKNILHHTDENARLKRELLALARALACGTAGKIHAIKAYRAATGEGLKESKDWVEQFSPPHQPVKQYADAAIVQALERRV